MSESYIPLKYYDVYEEWSGSHEPLWGVVFGEVFSHVYCVLWDCSGWFHVYCLDHRPPEVFADEGG